MKIPLSAYSARGLSVWGESIWLYKLLGFLLVMVLSVVGSGLVLGFVVAILRACLIACVA